MNFKELDIHPDLIRAAADAGFEDLTPIQEQCLQPALEGKDIAGIAQTGTGKTVAFLLPLLHRILTDGPPGPAALIVTPTRELCLQIKDEAEKLTKHRPLKITAIYGGEGYGRQVSELSNDPDIIVATPGRLIDYLKQNKIKTETLKHLVLDEADRMFDMGFIRDVRYIMRNVPEGSQTMLFSATLSYYVMRLASDFMQDPVEIRVESETVAVDRIEQHLLHLGREEKLPYVVNLILNTQDIRGIVFCNTRNMVQRLAERLHKYGVPATGISSLLDQKKRIRLLKDFKLGKYKVLVATDVASRGLDIDDISHVFNFDLPQDAESYVHRIGRTARAGKTGISYSFSSEDDYDYLPRIQRYLGIKIPVDEVVEEYTRFPRGTFEQYTDEEYAAPSKPSASGPGRDKRKPPQGKRQRSGKQGPKREKPLAGAPEGAERKPVFDEPATTDAAQSQASIRESDRAAILSGINTAHGKREAQKASGSQQQQQKPGKKRSGKKKSSSHGNKSRSYNRRGPGDSQRNDRDGSKQGQRRNTEQRGPRRDSGSSSRPKKQESKKGIIQKIFSIFGKKDS